MITVHYTVDPHSFGCTLALNDTQAANIFNRFYGKTDGSISIVNELAFEALRVAIAEDKIDIEHVLVLLTIGEKTTVHKFNTFGVLLDDAGKSYHYETPMDTMMTRRGYAIAAKQRIRKQEREAQLLADREARLGATIPEPLLSAVLAEDDQCRATAETYINKVAIGAQAGLQALCGDGPEFEVHQKL